jgi:anti-sigma-K factor RskA
VRPLPPEVSEEAGQRIEATSRERAAAQAPDQPTRVSRLSDARRRRNRWLAAAAAVVAVGGGGVLAVTQPWNSSSQVQTNIAAQVQQAPDAQRFQTTLSDGSTITIVRSASVGRAVLVTQNLAAAPSGQTYQMWLQAAAGNFVSAGLVPPGSDETVVLDGDAATAKGAGVSVEPTGGSQQPTTTPIALFAFA